MLFHIYAYFSKNFANITDYPSPKIFINGNIPFESLGKKEIFFIFDCLEAIPYDKQKEVNQCFLSNPDFDNSNQHLLVKLSPDMGFFRSDRALDLQEFIKSFIIYKLSQKEGTERKEKAKILFSFATDTELALISRWFRALSHTLGARIEKGDYEFYLSNVRFDRSTINTFDEVNSIVGLEGILVETDTKKYKTLKAIAEYFQIKKGRVVNPFVQFEDIDENM